MRGTQKLQKSEVPALVDHLLDPGGDYIQSGTPVLCPACARTRTHTHTPPTPPWLYPDVGACQQGRMVPESGSSRDISSRRKNFKTRKSKPSLHFSFWLQNTFEKWASLVTQTVKNLSAMWETQVQSLGQEDALEKGMATHSSIENSMDREAW